MKEFIGIVKNLWQNKRTRALAILLLYVVFFIFVFSFISSAKVPQTPTKVEDEFYYLNNIEISNYEVLDIDNNIILEYNQDLVNPNVIYKIVKNSILESTNFIDKSNTYSIDINEFEKIIYNNNIDKEGNIKITIYENKIVLDFISHYGYKINIDLRS